MASNNQDWEVLGRNIQEIIDQAVNSQDYRKLNQTITRTVNHAIDVGGETVRRAVDNAARAADNASRTAQVRQKPRIIQEPQTLPALYGSTDSKTAVGILKIVAEQYIYLNAKMIDIFAEGGMVATRVLYDGLHRETGRHIRFEALENFKVENARIVESWGYWPDREIEQKLNAQ